MSGKRLLIKIDVEGHEAGVLEGAPKLIASRPTFLVEIIRKAVADGVARLLPPDIFSYQLIDERTGRLTEASDRIRQRTGVAWGNYLVKPL